MKTLIWKEWREQRLFFFLAVGIIILNRIAPSFFPGRIEDKKFYVIASSYFILPVLFSLFLGTISFTNEFIRNTKSFLLSNPIKSSKVFWVKFLFGLFLLLFLIFFLQLMLRVSFSDFILQLSSNGFFGFFFDARTRVFTNTWLIFACAVVIYSAACFSSLLLKNSLPAIICTPFILLFGILLVLPLAVVLFLISPSLVVFNFFVFSVLIATFLVFCFLTWQKAIVKDVSSVRVIFSTIGVIFILSFGTHAIANLVATQKLNKTIQQVKAEDIKLTPQEVIPPPVPDKDNAALVYQQVFDLTEKLATKYKKEWEYMPYAGTVPIEKLSPTQKSKISRIMKDPEFITLYVLIEKAVSLPACRFDIKYERGPAMLLPHLAKMRSLARLVAARTYILTQEGRQKEALELTKTGFRLGDSLVNEPILISQLVRIAVDKIAMDSFWQLLNNPNEMVSNKEYNGFISEIDKKDKRITKAFEGELAIFLPHVFPVRLSNIRNSFSGNPSGREFGNQIFWAIYSTYPGKPIQKNDNTFYIQSFSTLIKLSRKPYFLVKNTVDEWNKKLTPSRFVINKHILSAMLLPALDGALQQQARHTANLDSFKLALALKIYRQKHGYYPAALSLLFPEVIPELSLDPFTDKEYIYRKEGRGFILYSVGPNGKDDNGIYDQKQSQKFDDIVWKVLN